MGYELHPERPAKGELLSQLNPDIDIEAIYKNFNKAGSDYGIIFNPVSFLPNTRLALLAGEYAKDIGKFHSFHNAVYHAYFTSGKDIGDSQVLLEIASAVGIPTSGVLSALADQKYLDRLEQNRELGRSHQVAAIPTYIINGQQKIVGAQPIATFRKELNKF